MYNTVDSLASIHRARGFPARGHDHPRRRRKLGVIRVVQHRLNCGDDPKAIGENRTAMLLGAGVALDRAIVPRQTHSTNVRIVSAGGSGRGSLSDAGAIPDTDALATGTANLALVVQIADCLPLVVYDPQHRVIANIHCGWRGIADGIVERAFSALAGRFGTRAADCLAWLGSCIGHASSTVGDDVAARFRQPVRKNGRVYLDLKRECVEILYSLGLTVRCVDLTPRDTFAEDKLFFAHRRDKGVTDRMATIVYLP